MPAELNLGKVRFSELVKLTISGILFMTFRIVGTVPQSLQVLLEVKLVQIIFKNKE